MLLNNRYRPYNKIFSAVCLTSVLISSGCAFNADQSIQNQGTYKRFQNQDTEIEGRNLEGMVELYIEDELTVFHTHKRVNDYTSKIAHDLLKNLRNTELETPIAIATFVDFNAESASPSQLGSLISESLMNQLQIQKISVVDMHLMDAAQATPAGSLIINSEMAGYFEANAVNYVLYGAIIKGSHGLTVNARISHLGSRQIMSSASTMIPYYVSDMHN